MTTLETCEIANERTDLILGDTCTRSTISHDILKAQIEYTKLIKVLLKKEHGFLKTNPVSYGGKSESAISKKMILDEKFTRLKKRKDEVISLCSNSVASRPWMVSKFSSDDKSRHSVEFSVLKIGHIAKERTFLHSSCLISPVSPPGILSRKFIEVLSSMDAKIYIQDIFCTLALVLAFEDFLSFDSPRNTVPQKIVCLAKYKNLKKNTEVVHVFNLCGNTYKVSVVDANFILEGINIPVVL